MADHIVSAFDNELKSLERNISEMGGLAEMLLGDAMQALASRDVELARRAIASDARLDQLQRDTEERAIMLIARRSPVSDDLRAVIAAIRLAGDLERVGDLGKNIAKRVVSLQGHTGHLPKVLTGLRHMADLVQSNLDDVLDAYAARDVERALAVWRRDDEVDSLHTSLFRELLTYMLEDPRNISFCTHLLFCAKNIERIGDHATNIAETIYYLATGSMISDERPKADSTAGSEPDGGPPARGVMAG